MKAVLCKQFGSPDSLVVEDIPTREPGPGQIRIRVHAAGVNPNDLLKLRGEHHERPIPPFSPGSEVAGLVDAVGPDVAHLRIGDRVMSMLHGAVGGWAEQALAPAMLAVKMPDAMDFATGACFLSSHATAYDAVVHAGRLHAGETVLVLGAGGGVGLAAVEIAKALGASVIAVAGSADKLAVAQAADADHAINYNKAALRDAVLGMTAGRGADVVIDPIGGELFRQSMRCTAWQGRLVIAGFTSRDIPEVKTILLLLKGISLCGANLYQLAHHAPARYHAACEQLFRWYAEGRIKSQVGTVLPLAQYVEALRLVGARQRLGKIVLDATAA